MNYFLNDQYDDIKNTITKIDKEIDFKIKNSNWSISKPLILSLQLFFPNQSNDARAIVLDNKNGKVIELKKINDENQEENNGWGVDSFEDFFFNTTPQNIPRSAIF